MNINKELVGAATAVLVLRVLGDAPNYGYEVVRRVNAEAEGVYTWQEGTIYPVLRKLEQGGLLRSGWETADNGRRRKYYHITELGREALKDGAREWRGFARVVVKPMEAYGV